MPASRRRLSKAAVALAVALGVTLGLLAGLTLFLVASSEGWSFPTITHPFPPRIFR